MSRLLGFTGNANLGFHLCSGASTGSDVSIPIANLAFSATNAINVDGALLGDVVQSLAAGSSYAETEKASTLVGSRGNRFKMCRVYTRADSTRMVNLPAIRNNTVVAFVKSTMSKRPTWTLCSALRRNWASWLLKSTELPITLRTYGSLPHPAPRLGVDAVASPVINYTVSHGLHNTPSRRLAW